LVIPILNFPSVSLIEKVQVVLVIYLEVVQFHDIVKKQACIALSIAKTEYIYDTYYANYSCQA